MIRTTYYDQECPTCGRQLMIRVEFLGKKVACQHCQGQFEACDPSIAAYPAEESAVAILRRVDELLDSAIEPKYPPR